MTPTKVLTLVLISSAMLGYATLTVGHNWGDDFAAYLEQARSVCKGSAASYIEENRFAIENTTEQLGPLAYPWGFPILLAPILAVVGPHSPLLLKLLNIACFTIGLLAVFHFMKYRLSAHLSCLLVALIAFNPTMLAALDYIQSDIPFFGWSMCFVYLLDRFVVRRNWLGGPAASLALLGVVSFAAAATRTAGFLSVPILIATQLIEGFMRSRSVTARPAPTKASTALPLLVFLGLFALSGLFLPDGSSSHLNSIHTGERRQSLLDVLNIELLNRNLLYYFALPQEFFRGMPPAEAFGATLPFFLVGLVVRLRRDYLLAMFGALNLGICLAWPYLQGFRFLYPLVAPYWYFVFQGCALLELPIKPTMTRWLPRKVVLIGLAGALVISFLMDSTANAKANLDNQRRLDGPFDAYSQEVFKFVERETAPDSVIMFFKPRAMRLFTRRQSFASYEPKDIAKADYLVIHKRMGNVMQVASPPSAIGGSTIEPIFGNEMFRVYRVRRPEQGSGVGTRGQE